MYKVYGEVNSVKNTTINVWLNDDVTEFLVYGLLNHRFVLWPGHFTFSARCGTFFR